MTNLFTNVRRGLALTTLLAAGTLAAQAQNVGIGTTAPDVSAALDIVSTSKGALLPRVASVTAVPTPATGLIVYQTGGTPGYYYNAGTPGSPNWQQFATASGAAVTASNGLTKTGSNIALGGPLTAATTIAQGGNNFSLTGGNVGVGTTAPNNLLDLGEGFGPTPSDPLTKKLAVYNNAPGNSFYGLGVSNSQLNIFAAAAPTAAPVMVFNANGNVGIGLGNTVPSYKLDVLGGGLRVGSFGAFSGTTLADQGAHLQWNRSVGDGETWLINHLGFGGANAGIRFAGITTANGTVPTEWARFLNNGYFGIGTTAPRTLLDLGSGFGTTPSDPVAKKLAVYTDTGFNFYGLGVSNSQLNLYASAASNGAPILALNANGNVGIGTGNAVPSAKLDVTGGSVKISTLGQGLTFPDGTTQTTAAVTTPTAPVVTASNGLTKTGNDIALGGTLTGATNIAQGGNNFSLTGGNVGIGTTAPTQALDVSNGGIVARANNFINNQGAHLQWNRSGFEGETWLLNQLGAGTANAGIRFGSATTANVVTEWARFLNNGFFGIGTTSPRSLLDLGSSFGTTPSDPATKKLAVYSNGSGTDFYGMGVSNSQLNLFAGAAAAGAPLLVVNANGSVGIGTGNTVPTQKLDVAQGGIRAGAFGAFTGPGDQGAHLQWNRSANDGETWLINHLGQGGANAGIRFAGITTANGTNPTEWARFLNNGNFGIGTTAPAYKLEVAGDINAIGQVRANGVVLTSDARFKQQVRPLGGALAAVQAMRGVRYTWNALGIKHGGQAGAEQVGVLAQELEKVFPELVSTGPDGYKAVNYAQLTPVLIEAIKEQQQQIEALKAQNVALQTGSAADHASLQTLQAQMARLLGETAPADAQARK